MAGRMLRSASPRKPTVSRWLEMASAAMRDAATLRVSWLRADAADSHHSSGCCSKAPGAGVDMGTGARPSATAWPSRVQATALVAVVLLSSPTTRSIGLFRLALAERLGRFVRLLLDGGHALLGAAVLAGQQLAELDGDDVVGDLDPGGQLGLRPNG